MGIDRCARAAVGAVGRGRQVLTGADERPSPPARPRGPGVVPRVAFRRVASRCTQSKVWVCEQAFSGGDVAAHSEPPHSGV